MARSNLNKVFLMGNLTRDVELRYTQGGTAVGTTAIAINRAYKSGDTWEEEVSFIDLKVWGKQAEVWASYLGKGRPVLVEGRLDQSNWQDKDGNKRSKLEVVVMDFQFIGGRQEEDTREAPALDNESDYGDIPF